MQLSGQKVWTSILTTFRNEVSASTFKTWFAGSYFMENKVVGDKHVLIVGVKNNFLKEQIETRYKGQILETLNRMGLSDWDVIFVVANKEEQKTVASNPLFSGTPLEYKLTPKNPDGLNTQNSFENFVVGNSNNLAYLAAMQVSQNIGKIYNPLFIYGQVGVGKTHLMQAIGNEVLTKYSGAKVLYVTSERFTNDYIESLHNKSQAAFRHKYRNVDVLLVDDVQFLAGKESTQDEFFHTFNELCLAGKQVVLASDKHPRELGRLKERLVSRFLGGMTVDIGLPDLEMRIAILKSKCKAQNVNLDEKVLTRIAESTNGGVRELEGILISVLAQIKLSGNSIAPDALVGVVDRSRTNLVVRPTAAKVFEVVSKRYKVNSQILKSGTRKANVVLARQILMYLLRHEVSLSLDGIGDLLGGRDHSTVVHGINKMEKMMAVGGNFRDDILRTKQFIQS